MKKIFKELFFAFLGALFLLYYFKIPLPFRKTNTTENKNIHIGSFRKFIDNFHCVEQNQLYRSAQLSPQQLETYIKRYNIKTVVNLRGRNENQRWWQKEKNFLQKNNFYFYNIPMSSVELPSQRSVLKLLLVYEHAPKPILIHCLSGADRTGEAAALWVLHKQNKSPQEALRQLRLKYRHLRNKKPLKRLFIKSWRGKNWLENNYEPEKLQRTTKS